MSKIQVKLWAAFYADPVSIKDSDIFNYSDLSELNISDELKEAMQAWDDEYQATFDGDYPPNSGFASSDLEATHFAKGEELAKRLQAELGEGYSVKYTP